VIRDTRSSRLVDTPSFRRWVRDFAGCDGTNSARRQGLGKPASFGVKGTTRGRPLAPAEGTELTTSGSCALFSE
jgi:hypothetical protein